MEEINIVDHNIEYYYKPIAFSGKGFPYNDLSDREFEELLYSIFKKQIENNEFVNQFDKISLMQGVAEKGRDCSLYFENQKAGLIQCKKYLHNINKSQIVKEILKFVLYYIQDNSLIPNIKNFTYYFAVSNGFNGKAIDLIDEFNSKIINESKIESWTKEIISSYTTFNNISYSSIKNKLFLVLSNLKVKKITPNDLNLLLNKYSDISNFFFEVRTVTDNRLIENFIETVSENEAKTIDNFISDYKKSAIEKLSPINFFGIALNQHRDRPSNIELSNLFVKPMFISTSKNIKKNNSIFSLVNAYNEKNGITISKIFSENDSNIIILGDPGSGKSLLIKYLILSIIQNEITENGFNKYKEYLPFRIELRKFVEEKVKSNCTLLGYLHILLKKEYQIEISEILLKKIVKNKKTLFFFDGLDEIFDLNVKHEVRDDINIFLSLFENSRSIITSRFIGYHDIKFNVKKFKEFSIANFNNQQIDELITKFFTAQISLIAKRDKSIKGCIDQVKKINWDLKSNPLILTLIIILVKNNLDIPDSKLEIYEACTNTLVEKRDLDEKELKIKLPVKDNKKIFANLAFWQYESISKKKQISYIKAQNQIAQYLLEKKEFKEMDEALEVAEKFLKFAEYRSIYFENNFTHKTFFEYYAAFYIYIRFETKGDFKGRNKILNKYISNPFWNVVFELLISMIDRFQEDDEVLDKLFNEQINNSQEPNLYHFLLNNITHIKNISNNVKELIIEKSIILCLNGKEVSIRSKNDNFLHVEDSLFSTIAYLCLNDNLYPLVKKILNKFEQNIKDDYELIKLYIFIYELPISIKNSSKLIVKNLISNENNLKDLIKKDKKLFFLYSFFHEDNVELIEIIKKYFKLFDNDIFSTLPITYRKDSRFAGLYQIYLSRILNEKPESLGIDYKIFDQNGLNSKILIEKIEENKYYYNINDIAFKNLIIFYLNNNNNDVNLLIEKLILQIDFKEKIYKDLKDNFSSNKFQNIDKIINKSKITIIS